MQSDDTAKTYDDWAETYGRLYSSPEQAMAEARTSIGSILRKKIGSGKVLEVGCGVGFVSAALAQDGFNVSGVDVRDRSLEHAQALFSAKGLSVQVERQDITEFAPDCSYDGVVAVGSLLEAILDEDSQRTALRNMVVALRPGGYLVLGLHDAEDRLKSEPDVVIQSVYRCVHDVGETLNFRTREWGPHPRDRTYTETFYQICDGERLTKARVTSRCIFHREVTEILSAEGMADIHWLSPRQTGYYQPLCVARKDAVLVRNGSSPSSKKKRLVVSRRAATAKVGPRALVLWSGGLDSTYCLHHYLQQTSSEVHVHHVDMVLSTEAEETIRIRRERVRLLRRMIEKNYREFSYSESSIDLSVLSWTAPRRMIALYFGAQSAMTEKLYSNAQIVMGLCFEENDDWGPNSLGFWQVRQLLKCIMRSEEPPQLFCPNPPVSRQEQLNALSREVQALLMPPA